MCEQKEWSAPSTNIYIIIIIPVFSFNYNNDFCWQLSAHIKDEYNVLRCENCAAVIVGLERYQRHLNEDCPSLTGDPPASQPQQQQKQPDQWSGWY